MKEFLSLDEAWVKMKAPGVRLRPLWLKQGRRFLRSTFFHQYFNAMA